MLRALVRWWGTMSDQRLRIQGIHVFCVFPRPDRLPVIRDLEEAEAAVKANLAVPGVRPTGETESINGGKKQTRLSLPSATEAVPDAFDTSAILGYW